MRYSIIQKHSKSVWSAVSRAFEDSACLAICLVSMLDYYLSTEYLEMTV